MYTYIEVNCRKGVPHEKIEEGDKDSKCMNSRDREKTCLQQKHLVTVCSHIKLLLSKGSVFVLGALLLVAAGIASQYHPPDSITNGNHSQCLVMKNSSTDSKFHMQLYYKHL